MTPNDGVANNNSTNAAEVVSPRFGKPLQRPNPTRPRGSYARMSVRRLLTGDWQTHRGVYPELEWAVGKAEIPGGWLTAK